MIDEAIKKLTILLQGQLPDKIDLDDIVVENKKELASKLNQLIDFMQETHDFVVPLSKGELTENKISPKNFLGSPFKELQSRLLHVTWQAKQVASGDFNQRVDFMGDFSEAFNAMIVSLDNKEKMLKKKIDELEQALTRIKRLEGVLPICSHCKKIRRKDADSKDQEGWVQIERYISEKTEAMFSHSICPDCIKKFYSELE